MADKALIPAMYFNIAKRLNTKPYMILLCCNSKLYKGSELCTCNIITMAKQSQNHGFIYENSIRVNIFNLPEQDNDTNVHDIPKEINIFTPNENISIKTTGSNNICCADILRFFNYDFSEKNTMIVIQYDQIGVNKVVKKIYEIDYNKACHKLLFGTLPKVEILKYITGVKTIPPKTKGEEAKKIFDYLAEKNKLNQYNHEITINPKVDGSQSRVQCSIGLNKLKDFISYESTPDTPNRIRGNNIICSIYSPPRVRGGITVVQLKDKCRENGIKGYSKLNKNGLEELLTENNIKI